MKKMPLMASSAPMLILKTGLGLLPVLIFLLILVFLDSYKLVRPRALLAALAGGAAAAVLGYASNGAVLPVCRNDFTFYSRIVSPLLEESLKAAVLFFFFFRSRKIGFLVDAAILGFSVGAGFSLVENTVYLNALPGPDIAVWAVRGIGTAMMHGGTTLLFAVVTKALGERPGRPRIVEALPGLGLAVLLHSAFNRFLLPPLAAAAVLITALPLLSVFVFVAGERRTRKWLEAGFDSDVELLGLIGEGRFSSSRIGTYLLSLKERFPGEIVADMFCLIRIRVELAIAAKGLLLMTEAGLPGRPDPGIKDKLREMAFLEKSIGPTGRRTIAPLLHGGRGDRWQRRLLGGS